MLGMQIESEIKTDAYVYALEVDGVVRYIGKGSGVYLKRAREHMRTVRRLIVERDGGKKIKPSRLYGNLIRAVRAGRIVTETVLARGLTEVEAFERERAEINSRDGLWNGNDGGQGGTRATTKTRKTLSRAAKARASRPDQLERLRKMSAELQEPKRRDEARERAVRQMKNEDQRRIRSEQAKARWADPEMAAKMKAGLARGRVKPSKSRSEARWKDPAARERQRAAMKAYWEAKKAPDD